MREAARKAGVSHQAPYHHFGDREAILAAIATEGFGMLQQELSRSLDKHTASQKTALETVAKTYVDFALRHPGLFPGDVSGSDAVPIEKLSPGARQCRRRVRRARSDDRQELCRRAARGAAQSRLCLLGLHRTASPRCCSMAALAPRSGYQKAGQGARRQGDQKLQQDFLGARQRLRMPLRRAWSTTPRGTNGPREFLSASSRRAPCHIG